jgi:hypothetical protein
MMGYHWRQKPGFNRRKAFQSVFIILFIIALGGIGLVNAQDLPKSWARPPLAPASNQGYLPPDMQLEGAEVLLSLDQAIQLALSQGTLAETASLNRDMGKAKAAVYRQTAEMLNSPSSTASEDARKLSDLTADFANDQSIRNHAAEINALKRDTVKKYYETAQARDAVKLSLDNLDAQQMIVNITQQKYDQGLLTKLDLLKAQAGIDQARADLLAAQNGHILAVMSLNRALGYPLLQNSLPTDSLVIEEPSFPSLSDTLAAAKNSRNEIFGVNFARQAAKYTLYDAQEVHGDDSPQAQKAEAALDAAKKAADDMPDQIEMDVRGKFLQVKAARASAIAGEEAQQKAVEAARVAKLSFDNGLITQSDLQLAQLSTYQVALQYSKTLLTFKLAIKDYELSYTEGTYLVSF